jgi:hypothetical protein
MSFGDIIKGPIWIWICGGCGDIKHFKSEEEAQTHRCYCGQSLKYNYKVSQTWDGNLYNIPLTEGEN